MRKADRCQSIKGNGNCPLSLRLQHLPFAKMLQLQLFAVLMASLLLLSQVRKKIHVCVGYRSRSGIQSQTQSWEMLSDLLQPGCAAESECFPTWSGYAFALQVNGSPVPELSSAKRSKRMTPFWRGVSLRPIGASCRDDSECITRLCRYLTNLSAGWARELWEAGRCEMRKQRSKGAAGCTGMKLQVSWRRVTW